MKIIPHSATDSPASQDAPEDVNGTTKQSRIPLECTSKGAVRVILSNVLRVLEQHPAWHKALGYDELLNDVVLHTRPPYLSNTGPWTIRPVTEQDYRETANWLQRHYQLYVNHVLAGDGLTTYAYRFPFHPIRAYLDGLTWDGTTRLDTWLATYCHVGLTPYTSAVASKTLIAAVARVYEPGCKVDTMTILEGKQGTLKSTVWNTLASDAWFTDWLPDLHDKDAAQTLCGMWFVEFGELSQFQRSEVETVKRFVSAKQDHYRPAYGRKAATFPRQNIFVGSTNETHYFKDHTGNRRFWPVTLDGEADIAGLARDRDQLWAEAVIRYRQGEAWYLTGELAIAAVQEQAQRVELDDWAAVVLEYSEANAKYSSDKSVRYITTETLLTDCLGVLNKLYHTQTSTKRLGGILSRKGWESQQVRAVPGGKQFWAWVKPTPQPPASPVMAVMGESEKKPPTHHSPSTSNDATRSVPVMPVMGVMGKSAHTQDIPFPLDLQKTPITGTTGITAITAPDSEATTGSTLGESVSTSGSGENTERASTASASPIPPLDGQAPPSTTRLQTSQGSSRIGSQTPNSEAPDCKVSPSGEHHWLQHGVCLSCQEVRP